MTHFITADESEFPIVKISFNLKEPSKEQFNEFLNCQKDLLSRKKPFVLLMDARKLGFLPAEIRIMQGTFFKDYQQPLKEYCLGASIQVSSPFVKMMIKAMMAIAPPPNHTVISSNAQEARRLAVDILNRNTQNIKKEHLVE